MSVGTPQVSSVTIASLRAIQSEAWRQGERVSLETLLQEHPQHSLGGDGLPELILGEYQLRCELGDKPTHEEYFARFPALQDRLTRLFEMPRAFDETRSGSDRSSVSDSQPVAPAPVASTDGSGGGPTPNVDVAGEVSVNRTLDEQVSSDSNRVRPASQSATQPMTSVGVGVGSSLGPYRLEEIGRAHV